MGIFQRKKTVVGLDVGTHSVKLVHLNHENDTYGILAGLVEEYPAPAEEEDRQQTVAEAIKKVFRRAELKPGGEDVVSAVYGAGTAIKQVDFPLLTDEELRASLKWQAGKRLPFGPDEAVIDYQVISRDEDANTLSVLLTAVTRNHLAEHLDLLKSAGIDPPIIDLGPLALANSLLAVQEVAENEAQVMLDLGNSRTILDIFSPGGLFFTRDIDVSGEKMTREIGAKLDIGYQEAEQYKREGAPKKLLEILHKPLDRLVFEIRRALTYYENRSGSGGFQKVYLSGGGVQLTGLIPYLQDKLGMNTEVLNALKSLQVSEGTSIDTDLVPRLGLAFGLATRKIRKSHV